MYYALLVLLTVFGLVIVMPKNFYSLKRPNLNLRPLGIPWSRDLELKQGLDIKGGTQVILAAQMKDIGEADRQKALETTKEIVSRRINMYGVSEASVQTAKSGGEYRLIVEIPGVSNSEEAVGLIGSTARLDFRELDPKKEASDAGMLVSDFIPTGLTGKELAKSSVEFDPKSGKPGISLEFTGEGARKFAELTKRNIGKPLAIFIDEYPITIPTVQTQILDGHARISGEFTLENAKSMSIALNAGALPVPISVIGQTTIGATLGEKQVERAVLAGTLGVLLIMLFMIMIYGYKGVFASLSLVFYGIVTLAIYKLIPVTLSLSGIAGFLLSMGMAVDTNILVFERLKEEERDGYQQSLVFKLDRAFGRAWDSIKDANMTTLITCFVLYNPLEWEILNRSGMVRGFAFTLALGILINLFSGMIVTRVLMTLFYRGKTKKIV